MQNTAAPFSRKIQNTLLYVCPNKCQRAALENLDENNAEQSTELY